MVVSAEVHEYHPAETLYDILKVQLIKRTAASEQRKLQQLINGEELGDCKPTQLLRRMQQLLNDKLSSSADTNSFLRGLFLQRLPTNVRGGFKRRSLTSVANSGLRELIMYSNRVFWAEMPLVVNCASSCANQTSGSAGQNGGSYSCWQWLRWLLDQNVCLQPSRLTWVFVRYVSCELGISCESGSPLWLFG